MMHDATYHGEFESTQLAMSLEILRIMPNVISRFNIFHSIPHIRDIYFAYHIELIRCNKRCRKCWIDERILFGCCIKQNNKTFKMINEK